MSTLVLCEQCPIFIIILIHTQAAFGVVSPCKASDHPGRNSQAPQNCAEERAVNQLCTSLRVSLLIDVGPLLVLGLSAMAPGLLFGLCKRHSSLGK